MPLPSWWNSFNGWNKFSGSVIMQYIETDESWTRSMEMIQFLSAFFFKENKMCRTVCGVDGFFQFKVNQLRNKSEFVCLALIQTESAAVSGECNGLTLLCRTVVVLTAGMPWTAMWFGKMEINTPINIIIIVVVVVVAFLIWTLWGSPSMCTHTYTCTSASTLHRVRGLRAQPFSITPPCRPF